MKKIIITILASFIGMSAMAATMLPIEQSKTKFEGAGLQITITGYGCGPNAVYNCNDDFIMEVDANNTIRMTADRVTGNATYCYYTFDAAPAANAVNKFTLTHVPTGDCAVITLTGSTCTAVEACGGAVDPDPEPEPEPKPSTIQFTGITINGAGASINSGSFVGGDKENFTAVVYEGSEQNEIEVTIQDMNGNMMLVNKTGSAYTNYPYTFIITNKVNGDCGKLIASSATQFTQSACDETPELTPSVSIAETQAGTDYIDASWDVSNYNANKAWIYYKKVGDAQYSKTEVSTSRPSGRISGLAAATTYVIKVRLEILNNEGEVVDYIESEEVQATTTQATFTISLKGAYTNYLTIGWDANFTAELYTVRHRPTGSGLDYLQYELSGKATSATITGLDEHTSYDIQVVAQLSAAQGGSRTASGVFTTLDRTSCNTVSYESELEDNSFKSDNVCEFKNPYNIEAYTIYDASGNPTVRIRYQYTQGTNYQGVEFFQRDEKGTNLQSLGTMPGEGNHWYYKDITGLKDGDYFYFAVKAVSNEACTSRNLGTTITQGGIYVTRKLNYKVGVGCNDATELTFVKGDGDKVFYLQSNATIARVEVYNPSGNLVATPEITKPGPNYVLNIANDVTFPTGEYTFMLYDINGRLSDVKLIYAVY